ncbi:hypothetical protein ACL9SP_11670 [Priestia flexa]|uniref:hypothetical protein n=1 Tax=Priestia TaxID=2800373 RepID=UPI002ED84D45
MRNVNCIKWCGYIIGLLFLLGCTMVVYLSTNLPFLLAGILVVIMINAALGIQFVLFKSEYISRYEKSVYSCSQTVFGYAGKCFAILFYGISYFLAKKTARLPIIIDSLALILLLLFLLVIGLMSVTPYE